MNDTPESDLVARLRRRADEKARTYGEPWAGHIEREAADIIENMRQTIIDQGAEIEALREREEAQAAEIELLQDALFDAMNETRSAGINDTIPALSKKWHEKHADTIAFVEITEYPVGRTVIRKP